MFSDYREEKGGFMFLFLLSFFAFIGPIFGNSSGGLYHIHATVCDRFFSAHLSLKRVAEAQSERKETVRVDVSDHHIDESGVTTSIEVPLTVALNTERLYRYITNFETSQMFSNARDLRGDSFFNTGFPFSRATINAFWDERTCCYD